MLSRRSAKRHSQPQDNVSRYRAGKSCSSRARRPTPVASRRGERHHKPDSPPNGPSPGSVVVILSVGTEQRLFAAHETVLCASPYFAECCHAQSDLPFTSTKRINLPDEQPETFSCILEYLYRGDYYPHLVRSTRNTWELENAGTDAERQSNEAIILDQKAGCVILKDTAVYCAAEKYGIEPLKQLALRKQGLQSGIPCSTILSSARYAYENTPDTESKLRAHYLALIIRCRDTFKRSGTMQMEMERGGRLFFDLFVAMSNHLDDNGAPIADWVGE